MKNLRESTNTKLTKIPIFDGISIPCVSRSGSILLLVRDFPVMVLCSINHFRLANKGFWSELLGLGDFYYELGVQIVDVCMATRYASALGPRVLLASLVMWFAAAWHPANTCLFLFSLLMCSYRVSGNRRSSNGGIIPLEELQKNVVLLRGRNALVGSLNTTITPCVFTERR